MARVEHDDVVPDEDVLNVAHDDEAHDDAHTETHLSAALLVRGSGARYSASVCTP